MLFLHEFASLIEINNQKMFIEIYMYMYLYIASNVFVAERFGCFKMSLNVKKKKPNILLILQVFFVKIKSYQNVLFV